ncbi:MAG: GNAT family N-acetyltransferase [Bacteroidota bacterium]
MGFRQFKKADIPQLLLWFDDPDIQSHLSGFDPPEEQFELILKHVNRWAYVWEDQGEIQAFAEVELEEDWVNLLIMVKAKSRKRGLGKKMLLYLQSQKLAPYYHAYIDPKNTASIACFRQVGFRFVEEEKGMEKWEWKN